jgi:hypothetical protein
MKRLAAAIFTLTIMVSFIAIVYAVNLTPAVKDDPLVRMPGTQPDQGVNLEAPNRCLNCHAGYNQAVEPGYNWMGSMMAQASRDPIFWACLTVAGQDSAWAAGTPNAVDICERCHFPEGWLGGRSDPPNASAMTGSDFDGLHCDFCHTKWDPFFETTYAGIREGYDWQGYWDEATPLSQTEADKTYNEDTTLAQATRLFNGNPFYGVDNLPHSPNYTENATGQYFVSTGSQKRASFADAAARHQMFYSRYHKSKYFCATCHDVSNPLLANLGQDGTQPLTPETASAYSYFHVERTWSEFMSSAYGQQGGAATNPEFQAQGAPDITHAAKCQDCHMRDVVGLACNKKGVPIRPDESAAHPNSGQPLHDLTGGNAWISYILASTDPSGPVYDPVNAQLLDQGPAVLTLDLNAGQTPKDNGAALLAGSDRAKQQLHLAATIKNLTYSGGNVSFTVQNNSAHKLISGFPEGRRMFVNIQAKDAAGSVIYEVNPYDNTVGTLKGLPHSHSSPSLGPNEVYVDELVFEVHPTSSADVPNTNGFGLTGETETFHFVLATGRYKDNRIPPKGFNLIEATKRLSEPVWHGVSDVGYFSASEYAGGYDDISLSDYPQVNFPNNAASVQVTLYYQGTSREYVEFLRDEINGNQNKTLPDDAYIIQTDPFFSQLKEWGNTIWQLWEHNHGAGVEGIVPFMMAQATVGGEAPCAPPTPTLLAATAGDSRVTLNWQEIPGDPAVLGYNLYYDQAGKAQFIETLLDPAANNHVDTDLTNGQEYCYKVTSLYDCDGDGTPDAESGFSNILCATPTNPGQAMLTGVNAMQTGKWVTTGKGKNQTTEFVVTDIFNAGDAVVVQALVVDEGGASLADATVEIEINDASGNLVATLLTNPSEATGWAEATWPTQKPNKKGQGGTPADTYDAVTVNVTVSGYVWDGVMTSTQIIIQ